MCVKLWMPGLLEALQDKQIVLNLWVSSTGIVTTARRIAVVAINLCIEVTNVFTAWQVCSYYKCCNFTL
jgi:hypothetical protein